MAVNNTLKQNQQKNPLSITYKAGDADVTLSPAMVKNYLVSGDANNLTNQEIVMFMNLCKYQGLNPFIREAYLVKYGNNPATIVTGKDALEKRAARCERFRGFEAGIIVRRKDGMIENRKGTFYLPEEEIVGGWAKVFVDGYAQPVESAVAFAEYAARKNDGSLNKQWASKPATMIRKVAKVQALREAFPENLGGMYEAEERGVPVEDLPDAPVTPPQQNTNTEQDYIDTEYAEAPPAEAYDEFSDIMGS